MALTPFLNHHDMLAAIDTIDLKDVQWQSFSAIYSSKTPPANPPNWMLKEYTIHFCDPLLIVQSMISNPDFKGQFDYVPFREFKNGVHRWTDIMSGNWAWRQVVYSTTFFQCILLTPLRMPSVLILILMDRWWFHCSLAATKHWHQTPPAKTNSTHFTFHLEMSRTLSIALIAMPSFQLAF